MVFAPQDDPDRGPGRQDYESPIFERLRKVENRLTRVETILMVVGSVIGLGVVIAGIVARFFGSDG